MKSLWQTGFSLCLVFKHAENDKSAVLIKWSDRKHEIQSPVGYPQKVSRTFVKEWENHPLAICNHHKRTAKTIKQIPPNSVC